jgi:hypothetical protein
MVDLHIYVQLVSQANRLLNYYFFLRNYCQFCQAFDAASYQIESENLPGV